MLREDRRHDSCVAPLMMLVARSQLRRTVSVQRCAVMRRLLRDWRDTFAVKSTSA